MPDSPESSAEQLAALIEAYLARRPRAADTEQGIAEWWMREAGVVASTGDVASALDVLLARGVVRRVQSPDGTRLYGSAALPD